MLSGHTNKVWENRLVNLSIFSLSIILFRVLFGCDVHGVFDLVREVKKRNSDNVSKKSLKSG